VATIDGDRRLPDTFDGSVERIERSALNYPDFVVFDLDPYVYSGKEREGEEPELNRQGFEQAVAVAKRLKPMLDEAGLPAFVKTSGKTGLHIYLPIERTVTFAQTHAFGERIAQQLVDQDPEHTTAEWSVETRRGKLFVDFNQNVRGKSLASAYSPRALAEGTLSKPLAWEQLGRVYPTDFTLDDAADLAEQPDPWGDVFGKRVDLARRPALTG
jgi:bifunctional non-homologous end joining protein LigD